MCVCIHSPPINECSPYRVIPLYTCVHTHSPLLLTHSLAYQISHTLSLSLSHTHSLSLSLIQTDATMTELEIEANIKFSEWSILQESGHQLVPCYGAGYTGLTNLGNSCYLNSVMQILFSIPEFQKRWKGHGCV